MSDTLQIAATVFWLTVVTGFAIWLFIRSLKRSENPAKLVFQWLFTAIIIGVVLKVVVPGFRAGGPEALHALLWMLICGLAMAVTWRHDLIDIIARPLTSEIDGGNEAPKPEPHYSLAQAKRKLNKPLEAIAEVRKQLAGFPNNFEGIMLLAGIQAEDLKDLPAAESTLNLFCDSSAASPREVAAAMNRLADWHLKLAQNVDAARAALGKVIARFPETELSLQAAQRVAHLSGTEKIFLAARDRQPMAVPQGVKNLGLLESSAHLFPAGDDPKKLAADYVKHLEQHPRDLEIREKLAIIYADHYQRLDLATGELRQLIEHPQQPARRVAHWLNLLADLQIRHGADYDTVRQTLEIIVKRFPDSAVAELARTRLGRLKLELKSQKATPGVKLGVYEQNLGLKSGAPRQW